MASSRIQEAIGIKGSFHLALTGGVAGGLVTEKLVSLWNAEPKKFHGLHLWWGDERFVDEASVERNERVVLADLRPDSGIHIHHVLASDAGVSLEKILEVTGWSHVEYAEKGAAATKKVLARD